MIGNPESFLRDAFTGSYFTPTTYLLSFIAAFHQWEREMTTVLRKGDGASVDQDHRRLGLTFVSAYHLEHGVPDLRAKIPAFDKSECERSYTIINAAVRIRNQSHEWAKRYERASAIVMKSAEVVALLPFPDVRSDGRLTSRSSKCVGIDVPPPITRPHSRRLLDWNDDNGS
ncbi:hypothetical protein SISSUDRAFT_1123794 [Sistotremastrum suecicum HHB10207 ss-3]|uniref:Uncharacterized protein n=1 Tax=Sistotremastrum suecicum HHB10207 ss-3 TaxID=1314776 RepID=A0A165WP44_9AGAM|nr:hypothetical protein SISSUDRAFT_1123794 [Sistotremastrum suecicum HHB10207 ss-3]